MALGSLVVELSANVAKFQSDFGQASKIAQDKLREIDKAAQIVKTSLAALGAGVIAGASLDKFKEKILGAVEAAAGLQELAERTGATVEALSSLSATAKLSNTDNEALATGLQKLDKAMVDAENGGKKTGAVFKALGIDTKNLSSQKPEEIFLQLAKSLDKYQDGAGKVAAVQIELGKSGANLLPLLKDLATVGEYNTKTTSAQAEAALEYEKNLKRLEASTNSIYKSIGLALIPTFDDFTKALLESQNANNGLKRSVDQLAADGTIREFAEDAAIAFGTVIEAMLGVIKTVGALSKTLKLFVTDAAVLGQATKSGFYFGLDSGENAKLKTFLDERHKLISDEASAYDNLINYNGTAFTDALRKRFSDAAADRAVLAKDISQTIASEAFGTNLNSVLNPSPGVGVLANPSFGVLDTGAVKRPRPSLKFDPNSEANGLKAADTASALLGAQIRPLEAFISQEKKLLADRDRDLAELYKLDQVSIAGYFAQRQAAEENYRAKIARDYDQEIAALQKYAARAKDERTRIEANTKIAETRTKAQEAADESARRSIELTRQQTAETEKYRVDVDRLHETLLGLQGKTAEATTLRFDDANAALKRRATVENDQAALASLATVRQLTIAQAKLNELDQQAAFINTQLAQAEQRINLEQQLGITDGLQGALKLGEERRKAVQQLAEIAHKEEAIARASGDPKLIQNTEAFRLKVEETAAQVNVLGQKIESVFEGTFANALGEFVSGTKTAAQAFRDFALSVQRDLSNLAAQSISKQLFSSLLGGGGGSSGGGFNLGSLFGSLGGNSNGAQADALVNSTGAAIGDSTVYGGGSFLSSLSSAFAGGLASGGPARPGSLYEVNERGPELYTYAGRTYLMSGDEGGTVTPAGGYGGGGVNVTQHFTVQAPQSQISRQTNSQLRATAGQAVRDALSRHT